MEIPKVSIIIPNYNGKDDLLECLGSVLSMDYSNFDVIVVDNGSTDGSQEAIREKHPETILIENGRNLGVTEGYNVGLRHGMNQGSEFFFILNNDIVADIKALSELIAVFEKDKNIWIAAPKIYNYKTNIIQYAGGWVDWRKGLTRGYGMGEMDRGQYDRTSEIEFASGSAFVMRREAIERIGLFDSIYFAYYEDTDFCMRVRKAGYKIILVANAKVWHKGQATTNKVHGLVQYYGDTRNKLLFMKRYASQKQFLRFLLWFGLKKVPSYALIYLVADGDWRSFKTICKGIYDGNRLILGDDARK